MSKPHRKGKPITAGGKSPETRRKYVRPGSAEDGDKRLLALKRDLIDMANDGFFDDYPDIKARVLDDYNPLVELAIAGLIAPGDSQRIIANKIVAEFCFVPLKTEGAAIDNSRQPINIVIAPWAAAQAKAIEHQPVERAPVIDYTQADRPQMHRTSPPQPEPTEPKYQEYDLFRDGGGVERPMAVEVPQSDFKPTRYRFDERTASYVEVNESDDA